MAYELRDALEDESKMQLLANKLNKKGYSKSAETIERFRFDLWNYKAFPRQHWRRIRKTNRLERIDKELKRRGRVAGAFSNDESLLRSAVCIVMDINEDWVTDRKVFNCRGLSSNRDKGANEITAIMARYPQIILHEFSRIPKTLDFGQRFINSILRPNWIGQVFRNPLSAT